VHKAYFGISVLESPAAGLDFPSDLKGDTAGEEDNKRRKRRE